MTNSIIIAAQRSVDQQGDLEDCLCLIEQAQSLKLRISHLEIDPLSVDWNSRIKANHFRTGCGPIEALSVANRMISQQEVDVIVIHGRDFLRSEHSQSDRHTRMAIYGDDYSLPEAYTLLAKHFCQQQGLSLEEFCILRDQVFDNLKQTAEEKSLKLPDKRWFEPLTELFRGVDCANPVIDFEGIVILCHPDMLRQLKPMISPIEVKAVGIGLTDEDGPEQATNLANYHSLEKALHYAQVQSGLVMAETIRDPNIRLDAYTCYPIVPLALLLKSGAANTPEEVTALLQSKPLTQTGGMNLARAPWNNPALNGLIAMCESLQQDPIGSLGLVHGNGGLGYKQGIAILSS